ncbi:TetR family transcriptional regulator [Mycolicibacterium xanthum]|uniref:TetR family transcriptional regulator n=1 Tax=Mycolicibacterium xanthum TaxID=2796469 RepID=UPI0021033801|nr:TetR family transcriptional regulator [Mycolicibacterium xanthum]
MTTRRIAERAGVPHSALCTYFRSRTRSSPRCIWACCATPRCPSMSGSRPGHGSSHCSNSW